MKLDYHYLVGKIQAALASDPRTGKLDVRIMVADTGSGSRIHLTGQTATESRRQAIEQVVAETVPGIEVRNELTVIEVGEPSGAEVIRD